MTKKKPIQFTLTNVSKSKKIDPLSEPLWADDIRQVRTKNPQEEKLYETTDSDWTKKAETDGLIEILTNRLFSWTDVPGADDEKLMLFLWDEYGVGVEKSEKIEKSDDDKSIKVITKEKHILLTINDERNEVDIQIDGGRHGTLLIKSEKGKLNLYPLPEPPPPKKKVSLDFIYFIVIDKDKYTNFIEGNPVPDTFGNTVDNPEIKRVSADYKKWVDKAKVARCIQEVELCPSIGITHIVIEKTPFDHDSVVYRISMHDIHGDPGTFVIPEKDALSYARVTDKYLATFHMLPTFGKKSWAQAFAKALKKDSETIIKTEDTDPFVLDVLNKINDPGNTICFDLKDYAKAVGDNPLWVDERAQRVHLTTEDIWKIAEPYKLSREKAHRLLRPYLDGTAEQQRIPGSGKRCIFWPFKLELLPLGIHKEPENPKTAPKTQPQTEKTNEPIPNNL